MNKSKSKVKRVKEVRLGWLEKDKIVLVPKETVLLGSFGKRIPCEVHIFTLPTQSKKYEDMPNQNKQEEWEQIKRWTEIQEWLDYLVKVGYINAKFDIDSLLQQEREKAVMEKVEEIRKEIVHKKEYLQAHPHIYTPDMFIATVAELMTILELSSLHPTNNNKE